MLLHWFPWQKSLQVRSELAVTTRKVKGGDSPPLVVRLPAEWSVEAGLGGHAEAIDVQDDWNVAGRRGMVEIGRTLVVEVGHALAQARKRTTRGVHLLGN